MKPQILELINFKRVDALLEGFNKSTGFFVAILDLEGHILSKSGGRQIRTHFHRVNPGTCRNCTISNKKIAALIQSDRIGQTSPSGRLHSGHEDGSQRLARRTWPTATLCKCSGRGE
jgi:hypothetical protein